MQNTRHRSQIRCLVTQNIEYILLLCNMCWLTPWTTVHIEKLIVAHLVHFSLFMQHGSSLTCSLVSATGPYLQPVKSSHTLFPCFCKIIIIIIIRIWLEVTEGVSFIPGFDLQLFMDVQFLYVYVDFLFIYLFICWLSNSGLHKAEWCDDWWIRNLKGCRRTPLLPILR